MSTTEIETETDENQNVEIEKIEVKQTETTHEIEKKKQKKQLKRKNRRAKEKKALRNKSEKKSKTMSDVISPKVCTECKQNESKDGFSPESNPDMYFCSEVCLNKYNRARENTEVKNKYGFLQSYEFIRKKFTSNECHHCREGDKPTGFKIDTFDGCCKQQLYFCSDVCLAGYNEQHKNEQILMMTGYVPFEPLKKTSEIKEIKETLST
jgi:hypothetical protein